MFLSFVLKGIIELDPNARPVPNYQPFLYSPGGTDCISQSVSPVPSLTASPTHMISPLQPVNTVTFNFDKHTLFLDISFDCPISYAQFTLLVSLRDFFVLFAPCLCFTLLSGFTFYFIKCIVMFAWLFVIYDLILTK